MILIKPSFEIITNIDQLAMYRRIEAAGRTCYKSESNITLNSSSEFIKRIIKSGHESVLEHEQLSIRFIVDRGVTHELVRHRLCAFSQESTRYCNYKGGVTFIIPPWLDDVEPGEYKKDQVLDGDEVYNQKATLVWLIHMDECEQAYIEALKVGWSPQQARSVLPNSLKTEIVCTANLRQWRHILKLRCDKAAHPQMKQIMIPLLRELKTSLPEIFEDLEFSNEGY